MRQPIQNQQQNWRDRVFRYKQMFKDIIENRFIELLPSLIKYTDLPDTLNGLEIETYLRLSNKNLIIGKDITGQIVILGEAVSTTTNVFGYHLVNEIKFYIPKAQRLKEYKQILPNRKGNYILLTNKFKNGRFTSDFNIIELFSEHLAEIKTTRYSLSMQAKSITFFKSNKSGANDTHKMVDEFFNGSPVLMANSSLDLTDTIQAVNGVGSIPALLVANKDEYNNIYAELLSMLGINSIGVEKASGVSGKEVDANNGVVIANMNIYIKSRQQAFDLLNREFGTNIQVGYDNGINSELMVIDDAENTLMQDGAVM